MPLPPHTLELENLSGRRGERLLFEEISLRLEPGEIAELRGPNGAGKTTLLLIVAGFLRPASGSALVLGGDPEGRPELDIGYLGHRAAIKSRLTVRENLAFWVAMNGAAAQAIDVALETVGLSPIAGLDAGYLSAGQTRRLAIARLIAADRPVWLLDEPTAALDAAGERLVAGLIDAHLDRGGVVLAATHHDLGLSRPSRALLLGQPAVAA